MAPHSSTLAWKIPQMEEPGGLQSMGSQSRTQLSDFTFTFHFHALEKEMATYSSVLAWRIPGMGEPSGLPSMGSHRVGHDWSNLAAAAGRLTACLCQCNKVLHHGGPASYQKALALELAQIWEFVEDRALHFCILNKMCSNMKAPKRSIS